MTVQSDSASRSVVSIPPRVARPSVWSRLSGNLSSHFFAASLVVYWEFHVRFFQLDALLLPPPSKVFVSLWGGMFSGFFLEHFGINIYRALSGFLVAAFL